MSFGTKEISFPIKNAPENLELVQYRKIFLGTHAFTNPLNHVNVYIIEDEFSLTIIDTGLNTDETKLRWKGL